MRKGSRERTETILNLWIQGDSAIIAEAMARTGWNSVTLDLQHGLMATDLCIGLLGALRHLQGLLLVRVSALNPAEIGKVLDAGADGVICPMIETANDARNLVESANYPPRGTRSFGPTRSRLSPIHADSDYVGRPIHAIAMIETARALREVAAIAAVPGLSGLYVGPSDLGMSLGLGPGLDRTETALHDGIKSVIAAATSNNLLAGVHCAKASYAAEMIALGAGFVTVGSDLSLSIAGSRSALQGLVGD